MERFSLGLRSVSVALLALATSCSSAKNDDTPGTGAGTTGAGTMSSSGAGGTQAGATAGGQGGSTTTGGAGGTVGGSGQGGAASGAGGASGSTGTAGTDASGAGGSGEPPAAGASVLQYHKNASRDGVYVDSAFTRAAAAGLHKDFSVPIAGPTYAQPLFFENGPGGKDIVIVATEENQVSAFDAANGDMVWQKSLAAPAQSTDCALSNILPLGITGTPVIDAASKTLYLNAASSDGGFSHKIYALSLEDGSTVSGWPVDVAVSSGGTTFDPGIQNQRGALIILDGKVFVPYGGHFGDCGNYHGWVVGVPLNDPSAPIGWATRARAGGIWAPGGLASDGTSLFAATGNTMSEGASPPFGFEGPLMWGDGEAILRLPTNLQFSEADADYVSAMNWNALDGGDLDIGGSGPVLFSVGGAKLVLALGKDNKAYLADATAMGGMGAWLTSKSVSSQQIINAAVAYTTPTGTFFAFKGQGAGCPGGGGQITAVKVDAGSPPTMNVSWCAGSGGDGSPMVTTTDGTAETIVWYLSGSNLMGFNGETGDEVFGGGGESLSANKFQTPIAAKGKIFVAAGNELVAFTL